MFGVNYQLRIKNRCTGAAGRAGPEIQILRRRPVIGDVMPP